MRTVTFSEEELSNLVTFMSRIPLTGTKEANALMGIARRLNEQVLKELDKKDIKNKKK